MCGRYGFAKDKEKRELWEVGGSMISEKDFEDILCKYPDLVESRLILKDRQVAMYGRRMDILFEDKFTRKLIVELKVGPIKDEHIGQILSYEGMLLSADDPTIRVMLIGNRVPPNIQKTLDHHGIAWKEITFLNIKQYLIQKNDVELLKLFNDDLSVVKQDLPKKKKMMVQYEGSDEKPALFVPIEKQHIEKAFNLLRNGRERVYFTTDANIGSAKDIGVKNIYFKCKMEKEISVKADFLEITENNPKPYRLPENENFTGKYYYGFKNLRWLSNRVDLTDLKYFKTRKSLRNDVPGACIIQDNSFE